MSWWSQLAPSLLSLILSKVVYLLYNEHFVVATDMGNCIDRCRRLRMLVVEDLQQTILAICPMRERLWLLQHNPTTKFSLIASRVPVLSTTCGKDQTMSIIAQQNCRLGPRILLLLWSSTRRIVGPRTCLPFDTDDPCDMVPFTCVESNLW